MTGYFANDRDKYITRCTSNLSQLEESLHDGLLASWNSLMMADSSSTFNQSPAWCMAWYRSFSDTFSPLVIAVTNGGMLVGLVPLAVDSKSNRLTFAGDNLVDYRDVVAAEGNREVVVNELLLVSRSGMYGDPLLIGPTLQQSETIFLVIENVSKGHGFRIVKETRQGWVVHLDDKAFVAGILKKETFRRRLNYYRRRGVVSLDRITKTEEWNQVKNIFYEHHSLRQLQAGRGMSFIDPRKMVFFDALLEQAPDMVHITMLRVSGQIVAEHYGFLWKGSLIWGAPAFDILEERNSPGQLLLGLLIDLANQSGMKAVDLTVGEDEFKKRFASECLLLPCIEVYRDKQAYFVRRLRDIAIGKAKAVAIMVGGGSVWRFAKRLMIGGGVEVLGKAKLGLSSFFDRTFSEGYWIPRLPLKELVYVAETKSVLECQPALDLPEAFEVRNSDISGVLKWHDGSGDLESTVKGVILAQRMKQTVYGLYLRDILVGWGAVGNASELERWDKFSTLVKSDPEARVFCNFFVRKPYQDRQLCEAAISRIIKDSSTVIGGKVYLICKPTDTVLRKAADKLRFHLS